MGSEKYSGVDVVMAMKMKPRVVVIGLASCFGCQLQITNIEAHLMEVLGQIDVRYWQLASSESMPKDFDIAIIEGAITTEESAEVVRNLRSRAKTLIALGACATSAGIPGMVAHNVDDCAHKVYKHIPKACKEMCEPRAISSEVKVDFEVYACPIDPLDFVAVLQKALYGSNAIFKTSTLCGECKNNESSCFFARGKLCLGLITRSGCGAKCVALGRACKGCRGLSPDANLESAYEACERYGVDVQQFREALLLFNQANEAKRLGKDNLL